MIAANVGNSFVSLDNSNLYSIINGLPNLTYILDKNCAMIACSQRLLELLEIKKGEETHVDLYQALVANAKWSEARVELLKESDINALLDENPVYSFQESPVIDKLHEIHYYESSRVPFFGADDNKVQGLVVTLVNVTESYKMAEQIEKMRKELQDKNKELESTTKPSDVNAKTPRILLIEDNSIAQKAVQGILMKLNCIVDTASNAEEMEALFVPGKFDLIFMDIGLKDTSGYVMSKAIRKLEKETPFHSPIIALTGYEAEVVKYDCRDYTMEGAITKPLTSEQAKQIIQHYIHHINVPVLGLKSV